MKIVSLRQEVDTQNEIDLLRVCQGHANIVRLHEIYSDEVTTSCLPFLTIEPLSFAAPHVHHHGIVNRWRIVLSDSNASVVLRERGQSADEKTRVRGELHAQ